MTASTDSSHLPIVVVIAAQAHSGSTLLDLLMGSHSEVASGGELVNLVRTKSTSTAGSLAQPCTCGAPTITSCGFWGSVEAELRATTGFPLEQLEIDSPDPAVFRQHNLALFSAIRAVSKCRYVVDSSKRSDRIERLLALKELDVRPVHLIRQPQAVVYSHVRKVRGRGSHRYGVGVTYLRNELRTRSILAGRDHRVVRYEELARDPQGTLDSLMSWLGLSYQDEQQRWSAIEHHNVGGNRMRFAGDARITLDTEWQEKLSRLRKATIAVVTLPARLPGIGRFGAFLRSDAAIRRPRTPHHQREAESSARIVYVSNGRLPTEKANGHQVMRMCEAFANTGVAVELWYPRRHQSSTALRGISPFDYYAIEPRFRLRQLPSIDVLVLEGLVPQELVRVLFLMQRLAWGLSTAVRARAAAGFSGRDDRNAKSLFYTRDDAAAFWLALLRLPVVFEAHVDPGRLRSSLTRAFARRPSLRLAVALTPSIEAGLRRLGVPGDKIIVWGDAVDLARFQNLPSRDNARQRLGLPRDCPIVGYVGRFHTVGQEKGLDALVRSMKHVHQRFPDALLVCVGGPLAVVDAYRAVAEEAGVDAARLVFVDRVPNQIVPLWLRALDVAVIPSPPSEFFAHYSSPLKLFEYMAAGDPIVASDLPALRTVLTPGETALLVEPGDPESLGEAICRLFDDKQLRIRLSRNAVSQARQYTWDRRARDLLAAAADPALL